MKVVKINQGIPTPNGHCAVQNSVIIIPSLLIYGLFKCIAADDGSHSPEPIQDAVVSLIAIIFYNYENRLVAMDTNG